MTCAGMSSGPSSVCVQPPKPSGTTASNHVSKSWRTSGEAFSLRVSDADVWRRKRWQSPARSVAQLRAAARRTSRVTRWKPRGRGREGQVTLEPHRAAIVPRAGRPPAAGRGRRARPRPPGARAGARPSRASRRRARRGARAPSGRRTRAARRRCTAARPGRGRRRSRTKPSGIARTASRTARARSSMAGTVA